MDPDTRIRALLDAWRSQILLETVCLVCVAGPVRPLPGHPFASFLIYTQTFDETLAKSGQLG